MQEKISDRAQILARLTEKRIGKLVAPDAPRVSVIIPAYNIAAYIRETLDSVFAQTFTDYEVIIVNDGSIDTEELETALAPFAERIVYAAQPNLGASQARNSAICLARGELLAFLDGDDVWLPEFLEVQIRYLEANNLEMVYCDALLFGEQFFEGRTFMKDAPSSGIVTTTSLISTECNVITSGTIIKHDLIVRFEMFDTDLPRTQDFDLWFRLAKHGARIGYQREVLLKYRVRPHSLSGTNVDRSERSVWSMEVVEKKYNLNESEMTAWKKQVARCRAELELEKGKLCLVEGNFTEAREHLAVANKFYRKPKLSLLNWLLRLSPRLTARLFKAIRPAEFSFIAPDKN